MPAGPAARAAAPPYTRQTHGNGIGRRRIGGTTLTSLHFTGRTLYLSVDPAAVDRQLAGSDLDERSAGPLRADISTDEITPIPVLVHYDDELGRHAHVGFETGGRRPIGRDAIRRGGFEVIVGGKRYGKGSSREHSPLAELRAGIRLVIAESFERIYRQNADNLGLFTSTDLGLLPRIRSGEPIPVDELLADRDPLTAGILRAGGLLRYGRSVAAGLRPVAACADLPRTLVEKIIARHAVSTVDDAWDPRPGSAGFVRPDWRYFHDIYTAMCAHMLHETLGRPLVLHDPASIVSFEDHYSYAHRPEVGAGAERLAGIRRMSEGHRAFVAEYGIRDHGYLVGEEGSEGISHAVMIEDYALPGQLLAGTDSHTPHNGALGCLAYGVGSTDMATALTTGLTRLVVPETLRIELTGRLVPGVMAKDIVLHLLAQPDLRAGLGVGKMFEFAGPAVAGLSTDERATLTNMTAELGGLSGIVAPDAETVRFLNERRGLDFVPEPWMRSDDDARYAGVVTVDCGTLAPMLARPGDPGNGVPVDGLEAPVRVDLAYGGSCTAGKRADFDAYFEVLDWAVRRGLRVAAGVRFFLQYGTVAVRDYCQARGYTETFRRVGAEILQPACGACAGCGPGLSRRPDQVTISAINRNFPGRSGPGQVWLASPATVAASAIAGEIVGFDDLVRRHP